jgi:hypothetical protein
MIVKENQALEETSNESFPSISVYLAYTYLPAQTFLEVQNIILKVHDFMIKLFDLDKEEIYPWYRFEIKELLTGNSALINFEFNFRFPYQMKKNSSLNKAIRRFAFVASLFAVIIGGQEIYLNTLKIENEKTKLERSIPPETRNEGEKLNLNIQKLQEPQTQRYITSVKKQLASAVEEKNIRSLQINGHELKLKDPHLKSGSFDL